jgi:hypothetical protein
VPLKPGVPVSIIYDRFEANDSTITLHPDPYGRGVPDLGEAVAELMRGSASGAVDTVALRTFLRRPSTRRHTAARWSVVNEDHP